MSPAERSALGSWFFVYPFVRAASRYTANFPLDHPFQAALYNELGQIAQEYDELGDRSSANAGLVKIGERLVPGAGKVAEAVNLNAVSPFTALPELVGTVGGFVDPSREPERGRSLLDLANPAVSAAIETLGGQDSYTGRPVPRSVGGFAGQVAGQIPLVRDIRQIRKSDEERARQVSPRTPADVLRRQVLGSLAPRPYNVEKAEEYARRDARAAMDPKTRARRDVFAERQTLYKTMKRDDPQALENGRLPKGIREAYNREAAVKEARARAEADAHGDRLAYRRAALAAEARLAEEWGVVDEGFGAEAEKWAAGKTSADDIERARQRLRYQALAPAYMEVTSRARRYVEERQTVTA